MGAIGRFLVRNVSPSNEPRERLVDVDYLYSLVARSAVILTRKFESQFSSFSFRRLSSGTLLLVGRTRNAEVFECSLYGIPEGYFLWSVSGVGPEDSRLANKANTSIVLLPLGKPPQCLVDQVESFEARG